jgi:hypothetical protein
MTRFFVMAGLPAMTSFNPRQDVDAWDKRGHDEFRRNY